MVTFSLRSLYVPINVGLLRAMFCFVCYSSGVKATDKREGSGSHNWGTVKDDIE